MMSGMFRFRPSAGFVKHKIPGSLGAKWWWRSSKILLPQSTQRPFVINPRLHAWCERKRIAATYRVYWKLTQRKWKSILNSLRFLYHLKIHLICITAQFIIDWFFTWIWKLQTWYPCFKTWYVRVMTEEKYHFRPSVEFRNMVQAENILWCKRLHQRTRFHLAKGKVGEIYLPICWL